MSRAKTKTRAGSREDERQAAALLQSRRPRWQSRERLVGTFMALPSLIPLVLFALLPVAYVVFLSFTRYNGVTSPQWIGLDNYQLMFKDQSWWQAVLITLVFAVGQIVIGLPLSLLLATVLNSGIKGMGLFRGLFFLPYVISIAIIGIVFYFLLRPDNGVINGILQALNLISTDVDWLGSQGTALASLVLVGVWSNFGINMVFFLVALQTVSKDLLESAQLDGANAIQRFRHVSLPLLAPITRVVVVLSIVFSLRSFDLVKTLTDGGPAGQTDVMYTYLFDYFFGTDRGSQYGYASALAVVASIIAAVVSLVYMTVSRDRAAREQTAIAKKGKR
ncbi:carbohydrate ABC transporter permease [Streptomyces sp. NPDC058240]|uniref:carbohydrate ABC transporter permease n=1 Tax=Streptomyces sp. NPDC058240 TaxID=3346396 RepID=UPI0036EF8C22